MATPPQDGEAGQHPPQGEGDGPPPAVLLVGPALGDPSELMALVGKPISVIGHPGDPNGERPEGEGPQGEGQQGEGQQGEGPNGEGAQGEPPCPLPPFVAEAIVPEQGAGGVEMRGTLEFTTVETTDESIDCYTFSRDDIQTEEGQPADFPDRLEFVGPKAKDFYSQDPTDGSQLMISGHPVQAPTRCGFPAFELTEVRVDGAEADNGE